MRSRSRVVPAVVVGMFILGFLSGCTKAPVEEVAAAKAALKAARDAEADMYMPKNFQNVEKAIASAEAEIALQDRAFPLSRNYGKAKQLLKNATGLAAQIKTEAPAAKANMKAQVEANLTAAREIAKETRVDVKKAPRSKAKGKRGEMNADLDAADSAIEQAATDFEAGDILGAAQKLGNAHKLMKKVNDRLSTDGTEGLM